MNDYRLRVSIDRLREELDRMPERDAPTRTRLDSLIEDLEHADPMSHAARPDRDHSLAKCLEEEIETLELSHPSLAVALNDLLEVLSAAGI